jgi:hypothetical protein
MKKGGGIAEETVKMGGNAEIMGYEESLGPNIKEQFPGR